jgi:signal transduction histidine kinase
VSNLVLNALQATPAGGRVNLAVDAANGELAITVEDSGAGVPPDLRERIWEPFFTTRQRGTGLGLAIVRKRVQEVGGSASLGSASNGRGAVFHLRLPLHLVA